MKILQSSFFRAICAIAVGILLIKYPDNTVTWITVAMCPLLPLRHHLAGGIYQREEACV